MAATIGPLFAALATAPQEWNDSPIDNVRFLKVQNNFGYEALVYSRELLKVLDSGAESWVYFAQVMREDGETLYVFASPLERQLFTEIKEIDGIGAKFAATALLELGTAGIRRLMDNPGSTPVKLPGLGPKTLEKIKNGIKAKRENFAQLLKHQPQTVGVTTTSRIHFVQGEAPQLIVQALAQVGLRQDETDRFYSDLVKADPEAASLGTAELIKRLLKLRAQYKSLTTSGEI